MTNIARAIGLAALVTAGLSTLGQVWAADTVSQSPTELIIQATIPRGGVDLEYGFGALWMMSDGRLARIDIEDNMITDIEIPISESAASLSDNAKYRHIAVGEGAVWITDLGSSTIYKVDAQANQVVMTIPTDVFGSGGSVGVGEGSIWVITFENHDKTLTRYNAQSGAVEAKIALPQAGKGVLVGYGSVWVTAASKAALYRIDVKTNQLISTIALHDVSHILAAGEESIWIAYESEGVAQRIDAHTGEIVVTITTGAVDMESDGDLAIGGGAVWVITRSSLIAQIDPQSNSLVKTFRAPTGTLLGRRIRYAGGSLWASGGSIFRITVPD